jgi:hypothetical protein
MQFLESHFIKVLALAFAATLLGIAFVELGPSTGRAQRGPLATAQASANAQPAADASGSLVAASPTAPAAPVVDPAPVADPVPVVQKRGGVVCSEPHRRVDVPSNAVIRARPGGPAIGTLPATSKYLGQSMTAWVQAVSANGRWGRVTLPWSKPVGRAGWVSLVGLQAGTTSTMAVADLSTRRMTVYRGCRALFSVRTAIGRPGSPSPTGRFWVTDRVSVPGSQRSSFGTFAFGMSTVQPNLPAGWSGGDQMAIHGTGAPGSIGQAASAGCLRVDEAALARLRPLLRRGTPIVITN